MAKPKVAVIIPAYNEEERIGIVLRAVSQCKLADEIIVVSDASKDRTATVARQFPNVRVLELPFNTGKGGAMAAGAGATDAEILAFVDADLDGLKGTHVDQIIRPILERRCDMCIGVFRGGKFWSDTAQRISPYISGQRAMTRPLFDSIPFLSEIRMGVEVTINTYAKRSKARVMRTVLSGVSNTYKETKMGLVKGVAARTKMYAEIVRAMHRINRKNNRPPSDRITMRERKARGKRWK
ncbi:MAG: glycosyltransferase [Fimbriimonadaceae bacterium]